MKLLNYYFLLLVLSLSVCGCGDDPMPGEGRPDAACQGERSQKAMLAIGERSYNELCGNRSRAGVKADNLVLVSTVHGRGTDQYGIYAVNMADSSGYVLVTSNPGVDPVLAVIESGSYNPDSKNPGLKAFIDAAGQYCERQGKVVNPGLTLDTLMYQYWEETVDTLDMLKVLPRLEVWYGQEGFYGKYCRNGIAGCGPTATGMAMSYVETPSIHINFDGRNEFLSLNWKELKKHKYTKVNCNYDWIGEEICFASKESHDVIGKILRQAGTSSGANYENGGTSVTQDGTNRSLAELGIPNGGQRSYNGARSHFTSNNILMVFANGTSQTVKDHLNHIFMVDGLDYLSYKVTFSIYETNGVIFKLLSSEEKTYLRDFIHVVWGFDNEGVGWYNEDVWAFSTTGPESLDEDAIPNRGQVSYRITTYISINRNW